MRNGRRYPGVGALWIRKLPQAGTSSNTLRRHSWLTTFTSVRISGSCLQPSIRGDSMEKHRNTVASCLTRRVVPLFGGTGGLRPLQPKTKVSRRQPWTSGGWGYYSFQKNLRLKMKVKCALNSILPIRLVQRSTLSHLPASVSINAMSGK